MNPSTKEARHRFVTSGPLASHQVAYFHKFEQAKDTELLVAQAQLRELTRELTALKETLCLHSVNTVFHPQRRAGYKAAATMLADIYRAYEKEDK